MSSPLSSPAWSERVSPDEAALFERLATQLRAIQHARAGGGPASRGLHAKANAGVRATFTTQDGLPDWARVGIFAQPTTVPALVRFSNGTGIRQSDKVPDVRGIGVKLVGVPGKKLIPGLEDACTQDFLGILTPAIPFPTPAGFIGVVSALAGPKFLILPRLIMALGLFSLLPILKTVQAGMSRTIHSLAEETYFSALPILWGDAPVKFALVPLPSTAPGGVARTDDPERLATDLRARLARGPLSWELRIQRYVDETHTPVEDNTVVWDPAIAPWVTVGRLTLPQQDLQSPESQDRAARVERLSFDPWHAPVEFRPLGAMMRCRAVAYRESVMERGVDAEPTGQEAWLTA